MSDLALKTTNLSFNVGTTQQKNENIKNSETVNKSENSNLEIPTEQKDDVNVNKIENFTFNKEISFEKKLEAKNNDATLISQAVKDSTKQLTELANKDPQALMKILEQSFNKAPKEKITELFNKIQSGNIPLPKNILFTSIPHDIKGAYSPENGGTIFLDNSLKENKEAINAVLLQELGHHIDSQISPSDSKGDEGAIFANGVRAGKPLEESELNSLRNTDDKRTIEIDGKQVEVETAVPIIAAAIWAGKAAAATAVDAALDIAIAAVLGTPPPGPLDNVVNFVWNAIPGIGEMKKVQKIAKLADAVNTSLKALERLKTVSKGREIIGRLDNLLSEGLEAAKSGNLGKAKEAFEKLITQLGKAQEFNKLVGELAQSGVKHSAEDIVSIAKNAQGKIVFLEKGNANAGLEHILRHKDEFITKGIPESQIPDFIMKAVTEGKVIGYQGSGVGRPIYELEFNGVKHNVAVTVGNNGFIVGANPKSVR